MSDALFDILRKVTTATITTMCILEKGIRRCWMNGPKHLVPGGSGRTVGPAFTLCFHSGARGCRDAGKLGPRHIDAGRHRRNAGGRDCRCRRDGRGAERRHLRRRYHLRPHVKAEALPHSSLDGVVRDRAARADERLAGLVRGRCCAGVGQRFDSFVGWQQPIGCGGCAIFPGDVIVADDDGAVVIPLGNGGIRGTERAPSTSFMKVGCSTRSRMD